MLSCTDKRYMKKSVFFTGVLSALLSLTTFSCQMLQQFVESPSLSLKSIGIKGLDLEGITFNCNYDITNPYPIAFSIKEVAADILCNGNAFTKIATDQGVNVAASSTRTNAIDFKITYNSIITLAQALTGKTESLPFTLKGAAALDLSAISSLTNSLSLGFSKDFDVPVFKPEFSLSDVKVNLPSLDSLRTAFTNSGMNIIEAASLAANIVQGKNISASDLQKINLDLDLNFNLNVKNSGNSPWSFLLSKCSLQTASGTLAGITPLGSTSISSENGTIPLKATLNTTQASAFIAQLLNKSGSNPVFSFDSGLSFPNLSYAPNIPLAYSREIPLSSIGVKRN